MSVVVECMMVPNRYSGSSYFEEQNCKKNDDRNHCMNLLSSCQRHSTSAVWQSVECGGQRLFDIWEKFKDQGNSAGALVPRPLSNYDTSFSAHDTATRTIIVLACKFVKLLSKTKDQLHRLDPDILRLDTLQEQVRVKAENE